MRKYIGLALYWGLFMFAFNSVLFPYKETKALTVDWQQLPFWLASGVLFSISTIYLEKRQKRKKEKPHSKE